MSAARPCLSMRSVLCTSGAPFYSTGKQATRKYIDPKPKGSKYANGTYLWAILSPRESTIIGTTLRAKVRTIWVHGPLG